MYKGMMFTPEAGKTVNDAEAFEYAKNHLDELPQEDKELFVEFFQTVDKALLLQGFAIVGTAFLI